MTSDPIENYLKVRALRNEPSRILRPLTGSEIVDHAVRVYQSRGREILSVTLVPSLFCASTLVFIFQFLVPHIFSSDAKASQSAQLVEVLSYIAVAFLLAIPLFLVGINSMIASTAEITAQYVLQRPPQDLPRQRIIPVILTSILQSLMNGSVAVIGFAIMLWTSQHANSDQTSVVTGVIGVLAIVIGCILWIGLYFIHIIVPQTVLFDGISGWKAIRRGQTLLKSRTGREAGSSIALRISSIAFLIVLSVSSAFGTVYSLLDSVIGFDRLHPFPYFQPLFNAGSNLLIFGVTLWLALPFAYTANTILYFESRVRVEGLDIEQLALNSQGIQASRRLAR